MCTNSLTPFSGTLGKVIDPGGYLAEQVQPKELKPIVQPFTGLHGTAKFLEAPKPDDPAAPKPGSLRISDTALNVPS